ncbi:hypothetical protein PtrSN002B_008545 [Pyrenophora tritici-repentis]|uniref:Mito-fiss-reg domain containing protein n=1 Tax=Pyrenophora tritici-repentis TaxID=45151 RepID=A0A2W1GXV6_9PLEO|nr:hypothetical protein PtrV1_13663 [Pyrenophora tritici-repentis]KAF7447310.1 hypothetical protein A1F99_087570 [Pyrenophora tritici-repentis]KAF7569673.1 Mito-fiss-reg domain containing protein [Pyrenophora tritici-repentis]KAG9382595.1 hypothetical protein A1F94_006516 [Pyrenophora tritici-repentis]KAI0572984.1 hypothetical protein Alg215_09458 [Pyrenophora tritici-repentis]
MHSTLAIVLIGFSALTTAVEAPKGHACQIIYDYCNVEPGTHHRGTCWWNCGPKGKRDGYNGACMVNGKKEQEGGAPPNYCSWDPAIHF